MWKVVMARAPGTAHARSGVPCQDACGWRRWGEGAGETLVMAVADGAGSAAWAELGAAAAVDGVLDVVVRARAASDAVTRDRAVGWMAEVRDALAARAAAAGRRVADYACTLLVGIVDARGAVFLQIGDGGWVVEREGRLESATWPAQGEFANETTFLTTESALQGLQVGWVRGRVTAIAGFTDGLQPLALNRAARIPHGPFFEPLFETVRLAADPDTLAGPLEAFLNSGPVNERTDDDKALVLAARGVAGEGDHGVGD